MPISDELKAIEERERWDRQLRELLRLALQTKNSWRRFQTLGKAEKAEYQRLRSIKYLKQAIIMLELQ